MHRQTLPTKSIDGISRRPLKQQPKKSLRSIIRSNTHIIVIAFCVLLAVNIGGGAFILANRHKAADIELNNVRDVMGKIGTHYVLPTDETPALATVTNKDKLTSPFLKKALNGDKVLIYQKNHLVIIYRPSIDRIIAVGPVTIDTPPQAQQQ